MNPDVDGERKLNEKGKDEEKAVGQYLKAFAPSAIYASPRERTLESAGILQKEAEIPGKINVLNELFEVYSDSDYQMRGKRVPHILESLVKQHAGEHIVVVTHGDVLDVTLRRLGATDEEIQFPCYPGQIYRIVFAGEKFVEALKLDPAALIR